jgi:single-strand DNA-binding protein
MAYLNRVFLIGNLTKDVELRYTPSGVPVAKLRIAANNPYTSSSGESRDETLFINIVAWQKLAENCAEYLSKGSPIFVEGRLKLNEYEWEGQKRRDMEVVARNIQFLSGRGRRESTSEDENFEEEDISTEDDIPF